MKRSQKELAALESAYKVCLIVKEHASNVIAGSDQFDDVESDIATFNQCEEFEFWYLSMMQRQKH